MCYLKKQDLMAKDDCPATGERTAKDDRLSDTGRGRRRMNNQIGNGHMDKVLDERIDKVVDSHIHIVPGHKSCGNSASH